MPEKWKNKVKIVQSRFVFAISNERESLPLEKANTLTDSFLKDEDGDLVIQRNNIASKNVITIIHLTATPLSLVGSQVWRGATYLADFILYKGSVEFKDKNVLELGGGTGLCSILVSAYARHVLCTDCGLTQLEICKANVNYNEVLNKKYSCIKIRELDWTSSDPLQSNGKFGWSEEDKNELCQVNVVIAADVIYQDKLTDSFLKTLEWLETWTSFKVLYIAMEKRINFTLETVSEASPAYDYFHSQLQKMENKYNICCLNDFPQFLQYDKVPQLELWRISYKL